ncbi:hypothetical protein [Burkholderia sp. LMU1-1-1.1]|uniref:hypothetical protein n=1 Tax=Burkholderia sp. LMU1-1-1.1 TaxID=3135266 RepID=UPI00344131B8
MSVTQPLKEWRPERQDEKLVRDLSDHQATAQIRGLLSLVSEDVMWWIRMGDAIDIVSLPRAFHESNHTVDLQLTQCQGNNASYYFDGRTYTTNLKRGSVPPFVIAAEKIPKVFKSRPLGRYSNYFERTRPLPGNDLTILVDELNAYLTGAELEVNLADTHLYRDAVKSEKYQSYDGNIEGAADFMLYILCYLKAVKEKNPEAYLRIKGSDQFVAHVQRLWRKAEKVFNEARPYATQNGGIYFIDQSVLDTIYSEGYITELRELGIQPGSMINIKASNPGKSQMYQ